MSVSGKDKLTKNEKEKEKEKEKGIGQGQPAWGERGGVGR